MAGNTCPISTFDAKDFLNRNFSNLSLNIPSKYHPTHTSSTYNVYFGSYRDCTVWQLDLNKVLSVIQKPQRLHLTDPNYLLSTEVYNETDAVLLSAVGILSPILAILRHQFPHLEFEGRAEDYIERKEEIEDKTDVSIKSRVDNVLFVRRKGSPTWHVCMILEYKTPGTLDPKEWIAGL